MKDDLTPGSTANLIRMTRTLHKGAFLVVEGDADARVYKKFVDDTDKTGCKVIPAHNKDNVVAVLGILEKGSINDILFIIDSDFQRLEGIESDSTNLLTTDTHDLETMILAAKGPLENILDEFGLKNKINNLKSPVREMIAESTLPLGLLRWLSSPSKENWLLRFRDISFDNFVDGAKLNININLLIKEVKSNSKKFDIENKIIKSKLKTLKKDNSDPWQVCSGHDMVQVLAIGFRNVFGNKKARKLSAGVVEGMLRIVYEYPHFQETHLYASIRKWEKTSPSYNILKTTAG
ncbi:MAG: DUF4435 domain-containing protein [bacterium]|nr:DUF4435 domain-containing protein [bacterium]